MEESPLKNIDKVLYKYLTNTEVPSDTNLEIEKAKKESDEAITSLLEVEKSLLPA